jgi:threonine dehydratase
VDDIVTVTEPEILEAIRLLAVNAKLVAEPSGAVTFAAFLFRACQLPASQKSVAVISGGNIDPALLSRVLADGSAGL